MFHVFGINRDSVIARVLRKNPGMSAAVIEREIERARPTSLHNFDTLGAANDYADFLRAKGFGGVSVQCQIFCAPRSANAKPGRRWIDARELDTISAVEQQEFKGLVDGGRFAPRKVTA